jgi:hypothetical protein
MIVDDLISFEIGNVPGHPKVMASSAAFRVISIKSSILIAITGICVEKVVHAAAAARFAEKTCGTRGDAPVSFTTALV